MWICRRCHRQAVDASRICRACGEIYEEVRDHQPSVENSQTGTASRESSPEPRFPVPDATEADAPAGEEGLNSRKAPARAAWKCPKCGEMVPGNFEVCWQCLSDEAGEQLPNAQEILSEVDEDGQESKAPVEVGETLKPEGDDESPKSMTGEEDNDEELAVPSECPRCGSTKVIPGVTVADQGKQSDGELEVVVLGNPQALIFKDRLYGKIKADICGKCGHVELRVANPKELYRQYRKSLGLDRPLDPGLLPCVPCQRCRMLMARNSGVCPYCGAMQSLD